jgi:predicted nuclease of predicted toxin-antitoxin system
MRFLVDMAVSPRVASRLRDDGHDAVHVWELGRPNAQDSEIFRVAVAERRIILTCDLDFGDLAAAAAGEIAGVILLRLNALSVVRVLERLSAVLPLAEAALDHDNGATVEDARHRIRRLPL